MQAGIPIRDLAWNVVEEALNRQNLRQPVPDLSNPEIGDPVRLLERPRGHVRALQQRCFNEPLDEHGLPKSGPQLSTKVKCDDARQRPTQQPACQGGILGALEVHERSLVPHQVRNRAWVKEALQAGHSPYEAVCMPALAR